MSPGSMAEGLAPLRARMGAPVREQEVLRVTAIIEGEDRAAAAEQARKEVLAWAKKRCGGQLPKEAWDGQTFEFLAGGRTTIGVRVKGEDFDLWALRGDDPDKNVAQRTWTTEVTIGRKDARRARLGLRLMVSTSEGHLDIEPHAPGLVQQIITSCGMSAGAYPLRAEPTVVTNEAALDALIAMLEDRDRIRPVFIATGDEREGDPDSPLINVEQLARATAGLAHVFVLPARFTYALTDQFGKQRSVFLGAVRGYLPGFNADAHPYDHPLFLGESLKRASGAALCVKTLRTLAARESVRRTRLGWDVLSFPAVRNVALQMVQERQASEGASDVDKLKAAEERIAALEDTVRAASDMETQLIELHDEAEERAKTAEAQANASSFRIQMLLAELKARGDAADTEIALPDNWGDFVDWCEKNFVGQVALAPAARRNAKRPLFSDVALAASCVRWLAETCRPRRIDGGGALANITIQDGIQNAPCGGDTFEFDWQGKRLSAEWHVKNGGNMREPERCLRIYYGWDPDTQQIVIADMPGHRRTGAT